MFPFDDVIITTPPGRVTVSPTTASLGSVPNHPTHKEIANLGLPPAPGYRQTLNKIVDKGGTKKGGQTRADPGFEVRGGANRLEHLKNRGGGGGGGDIIEYI